jgi:hypothetical protein
MIYILGSGKVLSDIENPVEARGFVVPLDQLVFRVGALPGNFENPLGPRRCGNILRLLALFLGHKKCPLYSGHSGGNSNMFFTCEQILTRSRHLPSAAHYITWIGAFAVAHHKYFQPAFFA